MSRTKTDTSPILRFMTEGQDWYVYTMALLVYLSHRSIPARFAFKNRTKSVLLGHRLDVSRLRAELDHVRTLGHTKAEVDFIMAKLYAIRGTRPGEDSVLDACGYADFLRTLRLPEYELTVMPDGQLYLEFDGAWANGMFWEIPALTVINQLQNEAVIRARELCLDDLEREGMKRLDAKVALLARHPECKITDFGTRRRFSRVWQERVDRQLVERLSPSQFLGTSCPAVAMELGIPLIGTNAHQLPMIYSALFRGDGGPAAFAQSQLRVLEDWWKLYGEKLSMILPDAFTTEYFLQILPKDLAQKFRGMRQDSGDPLVIGDRIIRFYTEFGINPAMKEIIFSDGLTVEAMVRIADYFAGRINVGFGWGTNLTNDLGLSALSLVIKPVWAAGYAVVKLSDNPEKATGDVHEIARTRGFVGTGVGKAIECVY